MTPIDKQCRLQPQSRFAVDVIKRQLDQTTGRKGLIDTSSFASKNHVGLALDDVVLPVIASGEDPCAQDAFRVRAPAT